MLAIDHERYVDLLYSTA